MSDSRQLSSDELNELFLGMDQILNSFERNIQRAEAPTYIPALIDEVFRKTTEDFAKFLSGSNYQPMRAQALLAINNFLFERFVTAVRIRLENHPQGVQFAQELLDQAVNENQLSGALVIYRALDDSDKVELNNLKDKDSGLKNFLDAALTDDNVLMQFHSDNPDYIPVLRQNTALVHDLVTEVAKPDPKIKQVQDIYMPAFRALEQEILKFTKKTSTKDDLYEGLLDGLYSDRAAIAENYWNPDRAYDSMIGGLSFFLDKHHHTTSTEVSQRLNEKFNIKLISQYVAALIEIRDIADPQFKLERTRHRLTGGTEDFSRRLQDYFYKFNEVARNPAKRQTSTRDLSNSDEWHPIVPPTETAAARPAEMSSDDEKPSPVKSRKAKRAEKKTAAKTAGSKPVEEKFSKAQKAKDKARKDALQAQREAERNEEQRKAQEERKKPYIVPEAAPQDENYWLKKDKETLIEALRLASLEKVSERAALFSGLSHRLVEGGISPNVTLQSLERYMPKNFTKLINDKLAEGKTWSQIVSEGGLTRDEVQTQLDKIGRIERDEREVDEIDIQIEDEAPAGPAPAGRQPEATPDPAAGVGPGPGAPAGRYQATPQTQEEIEHPYSEVNAAFGFNEIKDEVDADYQEAERRDAERRQKLDPKEVQRRQGRMDAYQEERHREINEIKNTRLAAEARAEKERRKAALAADKERERNRVAAEKAEKDRAKKEIADKVKREAAIKKVAERDEKQRKADENTRLKREAAAKKLADKSVAKLKKQEEEKRNKDEAKERAFAEARTLADQTGMVKLDKNNPGNLRTKDHLIAPADSLSNLIYVTEKGGIFTKNTFAFVDEDKIAQLIIENPQYFLAGQFKFADRLTGGRLSWNNNSTFLTAMVNAKVEEVLTPDILEELLRIATTSRDGQNHVLAGLITSRLEKATPVMTGIIAPPSAFGLAPVGEAFLDIDFDEAAEMYSYSDDESDVDLTAEASPSSTSSATHEPGFAAAERSVDRVEIPSYDAAGLGTLSTHLKTQVSRLYSLAEAHSARDTLGFPINDMKIASLTDVVRNNHVLIDEMIKSDPLSDPEITPELLSKLSTFVEQRKTQSRADLAALIKEVCQTFPDTQQEEVMNICAAIRENLNATLAFLDHIAADVKRKERFTPDTEPRASRRVLDSDSDSDSGPDLIDRRRAKEAASTTQPEAEATNGPSATQQPPAKPPRPVLPPLSVNTRPETPDSSNGAYFTPPASPVASEGSATPSSSRSAASFDTAPQSPRVSEASSSPTGSVSSDGVGVEFVTPRATSAGDFPAAAPATMHGPASKPIKPSRPSGTRLSGAETRPPIDTEFLPDKIKLVQAPAANLLESVLEIARTSKNDYVTYDRTNKPSFIQSLMGSIATLRKNKNAAALLSITEVKTKSGTKPLEVMDEQKYLDKKNVIVSVVTVPKNIASVAKEGELIRVAAIQVEAFYRIYKPTTPMAIQGLPKELFAAIVEYCKNRQPKLDAVPQYIEKPQLAKKMGFFGGKAQEPAGPAPTLEPKKPKPDQG